MRFLASSTSVALALLALPQRCSCNPYVSSEALQALITIDDLLTGSQRLQDIADENGGTRVFGSPGHYATVDYLYNALSALDYYSVSKQAFVELYFEGTASLTAGGVQYEPDTFTYSPSGSITAPVVLVSDLGCNVDDFPAEVAGNVALILRGNCTFALKATNAKAAGAAAAVVYNNQEGAVSGTLGNPDGDYVPVVGISQAEGNTLLAALDAGKVIADFVTDTLTENRTTYNVVAETNGGDKDNVLVLGGHSDSVAAGPGINDDGSGIIANLVVAAALSQFEITNAVRFGFWSAEEFGLLGSDYYVSQLNTSETEVAKIRAYLNFDMIASPNYVYAIYDGDGSAFNTSGPPGSAEIEKTFQDFFTGRETSFVATEFNGRSDYEAFIDVGIPAGGLFTGAEGEKTEEEAALFGGEAGVAYDENYHGPGDTIDNLSHEAYLVNTKAIADAVAKYALSFDSLPSVDQAKRRRAGERARVGKRSPHATRGRRNANRLAV